MTQVKEQRIATDCLELHKTAAQTHKMKHLGDNTRGLTQTHEWFMHSNKGHLLTGTTTENVAQVQEAILEDIR
jgi:hypothetical protein